MTFRVYFNADQAFLSTIKNILTNAQNYTQYQKEELEAAESATAIIICHSACEAFLNIFAHQVQIDDFHEYEKKSILDKIEILYSNKNLDANWSKKPLQDIRMLDKIRNWLTHFKDNNIGLINGNGHWVVDSENKRPKIDDAIELQYQRVERYYRSTITCLIDIVGLYGLTEIYEYLKTEDYTSYLIG